MVTMTLFTVLHRELYTPIKPVIHKIDCLLLITISHPITGEYNQVEKIKLCFQCLEFPTVPSAHFHVTTKITQQFPDDYIISKPRSKTNYSI